MTSFFSGLGLCASALTVALLGGAPAATAGVLSPARPMLEIKLVPASFWGQPYPYGYVYRPPPPDCWQIRTVETWFGPREERVWVCGPSVTARY